MELGTNQRPDIYLSYCSVFRKEDVLTVAESLSASFHILNREILHCDFRSIRKAISTADVVVVFFSNPYKSCKRCNKELSMCCKRAKPVFTVYLQQNIQLPSKYAFIFGQSVHVTLDANPLSTYITSFCTTLASSVSHLAECNRTEILNGPQFSGKFVPRATERKLLQTYLSTVCCNPLSGLLFVCGPPGIGKSRVVMDYLQSAQNGQEKQLFIWINCCVWERSEAYGAKERKDFEARIFRLVKMRHPDVTSLKELSGIAKITLVFDDVEHFDLIDHIRTISSDYRLPCCIITSESTKVAMQMEPRLLNIFREDWQIIDVSPMSDVQITSLLRNGLPNATDSQCKKLAAQCHGMPGLALEMSHKFKRSTSHKNGVSMEQQNFSSNGAQSSCIAPIECIEVPSFGKYYSRYDDEQAVMYGIHKAATQPKTGYFALTGSGGSGKTTLLSSLLYNDSCAHFLNSKCEIHIAFWLNCYPWKRGIAGAREEAKFTQTLIELGRRMVAKEETENWNNVEDMIRFYDRKRHQGILFVLDDCCHVSLLNFFRQLSPKVVCCVATRSEELARLIGTSAKHSLGELPNCDIVNIFEKTFDFKDKLPPEHLHEMAKLCLGSALVANQIAGFFPQLCRNFRRIYEQVVKTCLEKHCGGKDLIYSLRPDEDVVHYLFRKKMEWLNSTEKEQYFVFLLLNPSTSLRLDALGHLWGLPPEDTLEFIDTLEEICLVTRTDLQSYAVHQVVHEAASEFVRQYFQFDTTVTLSEIRLKIFVRIGKRLVGELSPANTFLRLADKLACWDMSALLECIAANFDQSVFHNLELEEIQPKEATRQANASLSHVHTLMTIAVRHGDVTFVKMIHRYIEELSLSPDGSEDAPLLIAASTGNLGVVRFISEQVSGSLMVPNTLKQTPLFVAARHGHLNVVKFLADRNPDVVSMVDASGATPLWAAACHGHVDVVEFLYGQQPLLVFQSNSFGENPFSIAIRHGHLDVIKFIGARKPECLRQANESGIYPIWTAAACGHLSAVQYLADAYPESLAEFNENEESPSQVAARKGFTDIVRYLESKQELRTQ